MYLNPPHNHRHNNTPHRRTKTIQRATLYLIGSLLTAIFAFRITTPFQLAKQNRMSLAEAQHKGLNEAAQPREGFLPFHRHYLLYSSYKISSLHVL
jgi:hypothetical protein